MLKKIRYFAVFAVLPGILFTLRSNAQIKADDDVIKIDTNLVTVPAIVSDRQNRYIAGLKAENFTILKDGQKQNIEYFLAEELRKQYLIGFYPENIERDKVCQIKVRIDRNEAVVRAKTAFRIKGN
jgi:hypothetical protein